jgi:hypothetical protein
LTEALKHVFAVARGGALDFILGYGRGAPSGGAIPHIGRTAMKHFSFKLAAMALAGMLSASTAAQAGGLDHHDDDDGNGYSGSYSRQSLKQYCYENPSADACEDYRPYKKHYYKKQYSYEDNGRCAALIRSAGKRNLVAAFARNSARFAWRREVQAVHGGQYANWNNARNGYITCTSYGALKACVATATPCRY